MQLAAESELEKNTLVNMLRVFGEWPRLTFVDCGYGAYGLAARVQAYGLRCIVQEDIPAFLGTGPVSLLPCTVLGEHCSVIYVPGRQLRHCHRTRWSMSVPSPCGNVWD